MTRFPFAIMVLATGLVAGQAPALAGSYPIADTGQTSHFDERGAVSANAAAAEFPGQDADHAGFQPSYRDNGDGTVTDLVTGLTWEKGYRRVDWADAEAAAQAADTGGHSDWRVPTTKELYSLMLFTGAQGSGRPESSTPPSDAVPFIDTSAFDFEYPSQGRYIDAQYVTSTVYTSTVMNGQQCFFGVNFADGRIKCYPLSPRPDRSQQWYAKFVRGNPDYGKNAFAANDDGTVTDAATGLMWTAVDSSDAALAGSKAGALTWAEALQLAENATYAGHDDWRLPNAKELQSLVDYSRSPDATGSAAIDPVFSVTPVTNAAGNPDFPEYWTSTSFEPGQDAVVVFFGRALGYFGLGGSSATFMDVHGAGAQRTDPKTGKDSYGFGPQGDTRSVHNYLRLVRDAG